MTACFNYTHRKYIIKYDVPAAIFRVKYLHIQTKTTTFVTRSPLCEKTIFVTLKQCNDE